MNTSFIALLIFLLVLFALAILATILKITMEVVKDYKTRKQVKQNDKIGKIKELARANTYILDLYIYASLRTYYIPSKELNQAYSIINRLLERDDTFTITNKAIHYSESDLVKIFSIYLAINNCVKDVDNLEVFEISLYGLIVKFDDLIQDLNKR